MDNHLLTSVTLLKQRHRRRLSNRKVKRRVRMNISRVLLDSTHSDPSILHSNIPIEAHAETLVINEATLADSNEADELGNLYNESHDDDDDDVLINKDDDGNVSDESLDFYCHEELDALDVISIDGLLPDDPMEYFNLVSCWTQPDMNLHDSTNVKKSEFCSKLLLLLRDAKLCKAHSDRLIHLIHTGLPIPNYMPSTMKDLLVQMNGKTQAFIFSLLNIEGEILVDWI
jgi:hypothetical protein